MANGKLVVNAKNQIRVRFTNAKNVEVEMAVPDAELSASLRAVPPKELNGRDVELDVEKGQPRKVRPVGEAFAPPRLQPPAGGQRREQQGGRRTQGGGRPEPQGQSQRPASRPAFHNPYNFVPAQPRAVNDPELGDRQPVGHHCYHANRVSGVIRVTMTLKTPLLLSDAGQSEEFDTDLPERGIKKGHRYFPVCLDADGKPLVAPTGIKGMLRSAYESVTNSRMAVFPFRESDNEEYASGHAVPLAYRMNAGEGLRLVPARIDAGQIRLLMGTTTGFPSWDSRRRFWVVRGPMYAAWLPRYDGGRFNGLTYPGGSIPQHGDPVTCWVVEVNHRSGRFSFWDVNSIFRQGQVTGQCPQECIQIDGYVCVTNANIDGKHDERVFFVHGQAARSHPITQRLRQRWHDLICNYRREHEADVAERHRRGQTPDQYLGREPGRTAWSRHVYQPGAEQLTDGTLCYAMLDELDQVTELFPVMISRRLHEASPSALLPDSLRPATGLKELSPADRVFGWVSQSGQGAYRGNVRVGPVTCLSEDAVKRFSGDGLPLAILGQPKEQQARFYVAASSQGEAQVDHVLTKDEAGYQQGKALRGRKVYPHHASLPADHWQEPQNDQRYRDAAESGQAREYIRHPDACDSNRRPNRRNNQNRSIQGWVKEGTSFSFDLHVTNLSRVELGALLWLLKLPPDRFHRLGGGKPLGFGSVRLEIDPQHTKLTDGNGWRAFYSSLESGGPANEEFSATQQEFEAAVTATYGANILAAFLKMASGFADRLPTHYPRAQHPPHPEGRAYEWFVENDRTGAQGGPRVCLHDLATDSGLPMLPGQD